MSKILITGGEGFVGQHLAALLGWDYDVRIYDIKSGDDLRDYDNLRTVIDEERPDYIYHLAAMAFVPESINDSRRAIEINTLGTINLLEAVRNVGIKPKILLAGTSEEYSATEGDTIDETTLPQPITPYAVSKLAMDHMGIIYSRYYNMHVVVTRTFNHTGPGRGEMYAESSFAKQIAEIENDKREFLIHGELGTIRNYTDVRDVVRAYRLAIELDPGIYNICSSQNVTIKEVLDILKLMAIKEIPTKDNPALHRPMDFSFKKPTCAKFKQLTGWEPEYNLHVTLADLLDYWRKKCSEQ